MAATVSMILDLAFPFCNMGIANPMLAPHNDLSRLHAKMLENMEQILKYQKHYCVSNHKPWCPRLSEFEKDISAHRGFKPEKFSSTKAGHERERIIKEIATLYELANSIYET